jgi:DNA polymerase (family 10)
MMDNADIARVFGQIADLLEIKGANPFKIRAYRNAADIVATTPEQIVDLADEDLLDIPGIGRDLAAKMRELADRGTLAYHEELLQELPRTLLELLDLPGLGPRTVARLYDELAITSLDELETAARNGRIRGLRGLGAKREEQLLRAITRRRSSGSSTG